MVIHVVVLAALIENIFKKNIFVFVILQFKHVGCLDEVRRLNKKNPANCIYSFAKKLRDSCRCIHIFACASKVKFDR